MPRKQITHQQMQTLEKVLAGKNAAAIWQALGQMGLSPDDIVCVVDGLGFIARNNMISPPPMRLAFVRSVLEHAMPPPHSSIAHVLPPILFAHT